MNLMLLEPAELADDGTLHVTGLRFRHLRDVLALKTGDTLRLGLVDGPRGIGVVHAIGTERATLACTFEADVPPRPRVDLLLALPRPKVLRRLFAQLAALGVGRIMLTNAARVERSYFDTHILSPEHYRPLLIEGLQQAKDTRLPEVTIHRQFRVLVEDALDGLVPSGVRVVAHPDESSSIAHLTTATGAARLILAVGPEGGWNAFELTLLKHHRFSPVSLGARTLRSDTACVALLALAHDALRQSSASPP